MEYNLDTSEEELIKECQKNQNIWIEADAQNLRLNYLIGLLSLKQQRKLLTEQNKFNEKLLEKNSSLVKATWVLAFATIGLAIITIALIIFK